MRELLRHRDFAVLLAGQLCSMFAGSALVISLAILAKDLTGSNAAAGLVILALSAPTVAGPFGAFLVDRVRRRPFLVLTHVLAALVVLPLTVVGPGRPVWVVYAVAVAYGLVALFHRAALSGLLQVVLPPGQLGEANALLQTIRMGMRLVAPLVGAGVYAGFGGAALAVLCAVLFLLGAVSILALRVREGRPVREAHGLRAEMAAGVTFLRRTPDLRRLVGTLGVALLLIGPIETAYFAVIDEGLGRPPSFMGVLLSIEGVGAVAGALSAPWVMRRLGETRLVAVGMLVITAAILTLTTANLTWVVTGSLLFGAGLPWVMIGYSTLLQRRTPPVLMGRVALAAEVVIGLPSTLSIGAGALLIAVVDYRLLLVAAALGLLSCGLSLVRRPTAASAPAAPTAIDGGAGPDSPALPVLSTS